MLDGTVMSIPPGSITFVVAIAFAVAVSPVFSWERITSFVLSV